MGVLKDFDFSTVRKEEALPDGQPHNTIRPGLAYMGTCKHRTCAVFNKHVVNNRGFCTALINEDVISGTIQCPICRGPFELETAAIFQCDATITVHSHNEETTKLTANGGEIVKFGIKNSTVFHLNGLLVTVKTTSNKTCAAF